MHFLAHFPDIICHLGTWHEMVFLKVGFPRFFALRKARERRKVIESEAGASLTELRVFGLWVSGSGFGVLGLGLEGKFWKEHRHGCGTICWAYCRDHSPPPPSAPVHSGVMWGCQVFPSMIAGFVMCEWNNNLLHTHIGM